MVEDVRYKGLPTAVDVDRIYDAVGQLRKGDTIPYERIEEILGVSRKQPRFWTVMNAFRRHLEREYNLLLHAIRDTAFEVLIEDKRVDVLSAGGDRQVEALILTGERLKRTNLDELTGESLRKLERTVRMTTQVRLMKATEARKLEPPDTRVKRLTSKVD